MTLTAPQRLALFSNGNVKPSEFQRAEVLAAHERLKDRDPRELTPEDGPGRSAMIRMELTAKYSASGDYRGVRQDAATAVWDGKTYQATSRHGATMALARQLVAAGCPDQPWEAGRPGRRDLFGPSIHGLAQLTIHESDEDGPVMIRHGEHPESVGSLEPSEGTDAPLRHTTDEPPAKPLNERSIAAITGAIEAAGAYPAPVSDRATIIEIAVFHRGQWFGSIIRAPVAGFAALDEDGTVLDCHQQAAPLVRTILRGHRSAAAKRRAKPRASIHGGAQDGAEASAGIPPWGSAPGIQVAGTRWAQGWAGSG